MKEIIIKKIGNGLIISSDIHNETYMKSKEDLEKWISSSYANFLFSTYDKMKVGETLNIEFSLPKLK